MGYTALYRKFRPTVFDDVKGQDHIVTTLQNQITSERLGHAYLFCGTRGTGKTTIAKILARAANCENPVNGGPCCKCNSCLSAMEGKNMNIIEIDAASNNKVDNIREIIEEVEYSPVDAKYKVYIIDEVHMLTGGAFNALLKTLEEPPSYVIFILATTEVHKIPITVLSRCQRYDFKRISIDTIASRLKELTTIENSLVDDNALKYIAKVADGSMRDALSLLDQCLAFHYGETLTYDMAIDVLGSVDVGVFSDLLRRIVVDDILGCIDIVEKMVMQGRELAQFVTDFTWYLRNLMILKSSDDDNTFEALEMSSEHYAKLKEEAGLLELNSIFRYISVFSELSGQIKYSSQKRILVEMTIVKLCRPQMQINDESVLERIRVLESKIENGNFVTSEMPVAEAIPEVTKNVQQALESAIPAEIDNIAKDWMKIVGMADISIKFILSKAERYTANGKLVIATKTEMQAKMLSTEDHQKEIDRILTEYSGKKVDFEIKAPTDPVFESGTLMELQSRLGIAVEIE